MNVNGDCADGSRDSVDNTCSVDDTETRLVILIFSGTFLSDVFVVRLFPKAIS